jgi:hypothetical protein
MTLLKNPSISPQFSFGSSDENYSDCIGYIIHILRHNGYKFPTEAKIPRERFIGLNSFIDLMDLHGFVQIEPTKSDCNYFIVYGKRTEAHIAFIDSNKLAHHMSLHGLRQETLESITSKWGRVYSFIYTGG